MIYSEAAYFENHPCQHVVAWEEHHRLRRKDAVARALLQRASKTHRRMNMSISLNEAVFEIVKANPGIRATEVAEQLEKGDAANTTSKSPAASCSSSLFALYQQGRLGRIKEGRQFRYWPIARKPVPAAAADAVQLKALDDLESRVRRLEEKFESVLSAPAEPSVVRARETMARLMREGGNEAAALAYEGGVRDGEPVMKALIEDLRTRAGR